jgi:hypothetical protein
VGNKEAQNIYEICWHQGQENLADYQSKHHTSTPQFGQPSKVAPAGRAPHAQAKKRFPFFAFLAKTRPKPPFGIPRAFQPSNFLFIYLVIILFRSDSALSH